MQYDASGAAGENGKKKKLNFFGCIVQLDSIQNIS
jgi:hypothetical protein